MESSGLSRESATLVHDRGIEKMTPHHAHLLQWVAAPCDLSLNQIFVTGLKATE